MLRTIIYANLLPFLALITVLVLLNLNYLFEKDRAKLFRTAIVLNLVILIVISIDGLLSRSEYEYAWVFRRITSFLNFSVSPIIPLMLYILFTRKKPSLLICMPLLINTFICILSVFFKVVFEISTENTYSRGALFLLPLSVSIFYLVLLSINVHKSKNNGVKIEKNFLIGTIFAIGFCIFLEIGYSYKYLSWDCCAVCIIIYYTLININSSSIDSLTGISNHAMYMRELSAIEHKTKCTIALLDINNFKTINDTLGHDVGDRYLILFASILNKHMTRGSVVYRIGGDEFVIISKIWCESDMMKVLESAQKDADENNFSFAIGISSYNPQHTIEESIKLADIKMYENKLSTKSNQEIN